MSAGKLRRILALAAAAGVLGTPAYAAAPGWADTGAGASGDSGSGSSRSAAGGPGPSGASLAEAVSRDLGLTMDEFLAAGEHAASVLDAEQPAAAVEHSAGTGPAGPAELAVSAEQLFQAYLREVGPEGLQAVVVSGGSFVIRTGAPTSAETSPRPATGSLPAGGAGSNGAAAGQRGRTSPAEFVSRYANVELDGGAPLALEADVPGGLGYSSDLGWICSTGFSVFDPAGLPAVLTAGHCASDGAGETATLEFQGVPAGKLGSFGFSQFGGAGNTPVENPLNPDNPGNVGTDVAVVESLRQDLDPLPAASTWGDPSEPGPDVKIVGTAGPVVGMPVCRSGRSSAWSCGTVDAVGIFVVPGPGYPTDSADLRAFNGFLSYGVQSSGGDSGGPYVSGNYAVGTHAAGDTPDKNGKVVQNFAVGATLGHSLTVLPGYQLELFLNKPSVSSAAPGGTYQPGQAIAGTVPAAPASAVPAGSTVRVTIQGKDPFEVPVDDAGAWSFTAPQGQEPLRFTAEAVNGFSTSGTNSFEFTPAAPAPPAAQAPPAEPAPVAQPPAAPAPVPANPYDAAAGGGPGPGSAGNSSARWHGGSLANTGASTLLPAAGAAAGAIAVGAMLMVLVRRRQRNSAQ